MIPINNFIATLQAFHAPEVFNPWSDYDKNCDNSPEAPMIRCHQLADYLIPRIDRARYLFVAEAAGYQGCRFTGIAITCERMLLDHHKQIGSAIILGHPGVRTSHTDCPYFRQSTQSTMGMNEPTDTYVWGAIVDNAMNPDDIILWNIFPFHPHRPNAPFTNRTPTPGELTLGINYTKQLIDLCPKDIKLIAIGQKSANTLTEHGLDAIVLRHPANGGAGKFREGFKTLLAK